jgi:AraC-like DNA-binding protein
LSDTSSDQKISKEAPQNHLYVIYMASSDQQHPLKRHRVFASDNSDEIRHILIERYGASEFDARKNLFGVGSLLRLSQVDVACLYFSDNARVIFPATGYFRQPHAIAGSGQIGIGIRQVDVDSNSTCLIPSDETADCRFGSQLGQITIRIADAALRRKFAAMTGHSVSSRFEFAQSDIISLNSRLQRFRRLLNHLVSEIDTGDSMSDLFLEEFSQLLITKFLTANKHNFSGLLERSPLSDPRPYKIRVVEEFIEANWDKPISIEDIASHTGIGTRNLFAAFKRARGYTPMSFLRSVRLQRARRILQTPATDSSVSAVYLKCGFQNAGHFAHYYRQAFGELPSETLARAR